MGVTVGVNQRTVVHKGSGGKSIAFPDVCKTQCGPVTVPIPYPNVAQSADMENGARTVTADGHPLGHEQSFFAKSAGDEAGTLKGVASGTVSEKAEFVSFSFDVEVEGKGVVRAMDQMIHNSRNTPPAPLLQPPLGRETVAGPPVVPVHNKVTVRVLGPYGEPVEGFKLKADFDGDVKDVKTTGSGRVVHTTDNETCKARIDHPGFVLEEVKKTET